MNTLMNGAIVEALLRNLPRALTAGEALLVRCAAGIVSPSGVILPSGHLPLSAKLGRNGSNESGYGVLRRRLVMPAYHEDLMLDNLVAGLQTCR